MTVKKGDKIKVDYEGKLEDGSVFDSSKHGDHSHPLEFEVGEGKIIKGFDEGVIGMEIGDEKEITIKPEDGYGMPNPELTQKIPKDKIPPGQEIKPGMILALGAPDGRQVPATVKEVSDTEVTIDINHPLAGKTLIFNVKLLEIN